MSYRIEEEGAEAQEHPPDRIESNLSFLNALGMKVIDGAHPFGLITTNTCAPFTPSA